MRMILIVLFLSGSLLAEDAAPKSPAAIQAQKKFDAAATKARTTYLQTMIVAEKQLLSDLDAAMKTAMRSSNIDEADAIKSKKSDVQTKLDENQAELKNPKGVDDPAASDVPASGDVLTFAGIVAMLPKELKPSGRGAWDQATIVKANEWVKENIVGRTIEIVGINAGQQSVQSEESATTFFSLPNLSGFVVATDFKGKAAVAGLLKTKHGQRAKVRGLISGLRFDSETRGYLSIDSAEIAN